MSIETRVRGTTSLQGGAGGGGGGGSGSGVVNIGSATYLAYYPALGTTVDDTTLSVTTGSGIAPFNIPILTSDPSSISSGDMWILNSGGVFLRVAITNTNYTVQLTTPAP